jgi:hypothetical protein
MFQAWLVNFNLPLQAFEPQVKGLRNLIDFALDSPHSTPPRLLFVCSLIMLLSKCFMTVD